MHGRLYGYVEEDLHKKGEFCTECRQRKIDKRVNREMSSGSLYDSVSTLSINYKVSFSKDTASGINIFITITSVM